MWFHASMLLHSLHFIIAVPYSTLPSYLIKVLCKYHFHTEAFPDHSSVVGTPTSSYAHFHLLGEGGSHAAQHVGSQYLNQGLNPHFLQWEFGVLTIELPGKSPHFHLCICKIFIELIYMSDLPSQIINFWGYKSEYIEREKKLRKFINFQKQIPKHHKSWNCYTHTHIHIYTHTHRRLYMYITSLTGQHISISLSLCIFDYLFLSIVVRPLHMRSTLLAKF